MATHHTFDVIVVGAGQAGGPIANAFAGAGKRTAIIEREAPGGTCVNWGCTPTKTMVASGRVAYLARRAADFGVRTGEVTVDMAAVRQRKRDIVDTDREGSRKAIEETSGLTYFEGEARFTSEKTLTVALTSGGEEVLRADTIILDVGERARPLGLDNPDSVTVLDNRTVMELDEVPVHLIVVGGGPIGLEFAQLYRRLGAEVTIVHRGDQLLPREDRDIAEAVAEILREDGIRLELGARPTTIGRAGDGVVLTIEGQDGSSTLGCSHVLAAAGRVPNTDLLDVEQTGLSLDDHGYLPTNDQLETEVPGIYAVGDMRPGPKFTHISYDDFRILRANLIEGGARSVSDRIVAATTYIDPQLGRVGPTERDVREAGTPYLIATMPMTGVARARETAEARGLAKVLVHAETKRVLGVAVLGLEGGEIASMFQIAMMGDLPYTALENAVVAHPTLAETLNNVFGNLKEPDRA